MIDFNFQILNSKGKFLRLSDIMNIHGLLLYEEKSRNVPKMGKILVSKAFQSCKISFLKPLEKPML